MSSNVKLLHQPFGHGPDVAYARKPWIYCEFCGKNTWRKHRGTDGLGGHSWKFCNRACQKGALKEARKHYW